MSTLNPFLLIPIAWGSYLSVGVMGIASYVFNEDVHAVWFLFCILMTYIAVCESILPYLKRIRWHVVVLLIAGALCPILIFAASMFGLELRPQIFSENGLLTFLILIKPRAFHAYFYTGLVTLLSVATCWVIRFGVTRPQRGPDF